MLYPYLIVIILILSGAAYFMGLSKAIKLSDTLGGIRHLHSLPSHYGMVNLLACGLPALIIFSIWQIIEGSVVSSMIMHELPVEYQHLNKNELSLVMNDIKNLVSGGILSGTPSDAVKAAANSYIALQQNCRNIISFTVVAILGLSFYFSNSSISAELRARNIVERIINILLILCSGVAVLTTIGIVLSVLFEAIRFFQIVPLQDFLLGLDWSPQTAMRADQEGSSGAFGAVPIFAGTMLIAAIAMGVAIPVGLMSAIYLSEYASSRLRTFAKPALEILAGIPTVVYGFFAALTVAPLFRGFGESMGLSVSSESAMAAGLVMGIMIIPFVSSLSDDVIHAVPQAMRDGSYGLGATKFETIKHVVIPAALPGIVGSILLAVSRAIGETMIVVMAAGLSANLTANPFQAVTTVTVQIVTLLVGDQEFDSPKTLAAFALGLLLFVFTLCLNIIALRVVRKYREQYE